MAATDETGKIYEDILPVSWGLNRDPKSFKLIDKRERPLIDYGFTGHEHLDEFGLINMNGRVYDPAIGRFLSADNGACPASSGMQFSGDLQSFNRYSYCWNNPLKFIDPSGESVNPFNSLVNWMDNIWNTGTPNTASKPSWDGFAANAFSK